MAQFKAPTQSNRIPKHEIVKKENAIKQDIEKIEKVLIEKNEDEMLKLHRSLDGKYQNSISNWGYSMYGYIEGHGFEPDFLDSKSLENNLELMKAKLEGLLLNLSRMMPKTTANMNLILQNNNENNNNAIVNLTMSFEEAKAKIEDMTALSQTETDEIIERIDELEQISQEDISKKKKWEKVKPIIVFALDKGMDVAITILSLVLQLKF